MVAEQVRERLARLGARRLDDIIGRVERLRVRKRSLAWHAKAAHLDLSAITQSAIAPTSGVIARRFERAVPWGLSDHIDQSVLPHAQGTAPVDISLPIDNSKRAAGTLLSGEVARLHGARGLPDGTITVRYNGSAGQSFGAFLAPGITLELSGDANDYVGKGMSGGRLIVKVPPGSRFVPEDNVIIGNVALYGATAGDLFVGGLAGERFAVRNSGARAVVEGVGDHGCEYMTGGVVIVLGAVGRNFAAGMSGGVAYVFDPQQTFRTHCNTEMVELEPLSADSDIWLVHGLIEDHVRFTASPRATKLLDNWDHVLARFVKVMPVDYRRALERRRSGSQPPPVSTPTSLSSSRAAGG